MRMHRNRGHLEENNSIVTELDWVIVHMKYKGTITIVKGTNSEMLLSSSFSWTLPVNLRVCN